MRRGGPVKSSHLLCALVLCVAATLVTACGPRRGEPENPPVPWGPAFFSSKSPETPPPGRPFSDRGVIYPGKPPTPEALRASAQGVNVLLIVLDAARADRFGCYGYPRETTPNVDALAKKSLVFEQHFAQASVTRASTSSLLASQYPDTHGILDNGEGESYLPEWPEDLPTVEKALTRRGYQTFLIASSPVPSPELGICTDFQHSWYPAPEGFPDSSDPVRFTLEGFAWMQELWRSTLGNPFFAYVHIMPPHRPYAAPAEIAKEFQREIPPRCWGVPPALAEMAEINSVERANVPPPRHWDNYYDANLKWGDWCVGEILKSLRKEGELDRTLVIVTADHGEGLGEHGLAYHMYCPYDEALQIPLVMRLPGAEKPTGRVKALTETVDVVPTLLDLLRMEAGEAGFQGRSLVPLLAGEVTEVNQFVFSRTAGRKAWYIVRDAQGALMLHHEGKLRTYFDLEADPWQTRDLMAEQPDQAAGLERAFAEFVERQAYPPLSFLEGDVKPSAAPPSARPKLSEETRRKLESLGYLK